MLKTSVTCSKTKQFFFPLGFFFSIVVRTLNIGATLLMTSLKCIVQDCKLVAWCLQQTSRNRSSCVTETLHPLNNSSPFPPVPRPCQLTFYPPPLSLTTLDISCMWTQAAHPSVNALFHLHNELPIHPYSSFGVRI